MKLEMKKDITEEELYASFKIRELYFEHKEEMRKKGIKVNQEQFASEIGMCQALFSSYLCGKTPIRTIDNLKRFSKLFGVKCSYLRPDLV